MKKLHSFPKELNSINFSDGFHKWPHIPNYDRLPIYVSNREVEQDNEGISYNFVEKDWELKTSFWIKSDAKKYYYKIKGSAQGEGELSLTHYNNSCYTCVDKKSISGNFEITFNVPNQYCSQYGLLFNLTMKGSKIKIKEISLEYKSKIQPHVNLLPKHWDYIWRRAGNVNFYFSTNLFHSYIPEIQWLARAESLKIEEVYKQPCELENELNYLFQADDMETSAQKYLLSKRSPVLNKKTITMLVPDDRIDRRVLIQARTLVRNNWRVVVIAAPAREGEEFNDENAFPEVLIERIDTLKAVSNLQHLKQKTDLLLPKDYDWQKVYWYHYHFLEKALEYPASIYVAHDLHVLAAACAASAVHNASLVYDAHELFPEQSHFEDELAMLYRMAEKELAVKANLIITINESIAYEMAQRYQVKFPMIIFNTPDIQDRAFPLVHQDKFRKIFPITQKQKIILYQGAISLNRNLENLVGAMATLKREDIVLILMGPDSGKLNELESIAKQEGILNKKVYFHPTVSQQELLDYTTSADVGIIPYPQIDINTTLCSPNKLFEYLVAGVPILANNSPELEKLVKSQNAGMVCPMRNIAEIAQGIEEIFNLNLPEIRRNLSKNSVNFTWFSQEKKLLNLYNLVLQDS